jgi:hypothetical protein
MVHTIFLEKCGIDDDEFSELLDGMMQILRLEKIYYKSNVFGPMSLEALKPVLYRQIPKPLQVLRLVNCTTNGAIINDLLQYLLDEDVSLVSLGLVDMQILEPTMEKIAKFVTVNRSLEVLDLSWNDLTPKAYLPLV